MTGVDSQQASPLAHGESVSVRGLTKSFGIVRAVGDVSFDIAAGEFLALLGPSGSGKTTILMTIAGFERQDKGDVFVGGRRITHLPPHHRGIGMVFQKYALFPHMTVAENIGFPLRMRRISTIERTRRVAGALELVRLSGLGSRRPGQLSGGQQQRVALARALVFGPSVLLMDEPLGALDRKLREEMQLEIKHIQQRVGTTVVYVTHDQGEALTMADRIAVIHEGKLQQVGAPVEIYERPGNAFVAAFIGETNLIDGTLGDYDGVGWNVTLPTGPTVKVEFPEDRAFHPESGTPVRLAIRPERVMVKRRGAASGGHPGAIEEIVYRGDSTSLLVRLGAQISMVARVPADPGTWRKGQLVDICWASHDARVYLRGEK